MKRPEALQAAHDLIDDAWDLLRDREGSSEVQEAWDRHVEALITQGSDHASDAAVYAGIHERDFGYRVGLLVGGMVAGRRDGSALTLPEVASALVDAAAWKDADADASDWPRDRTHLDGEVVPRMSDEERVELQAVIDVLLPARRASEVAAVGDATAAATDLWRALDGVDLDSASLEQLVELDRVQQVARMEGRARLERALDANPAWRA